jgi:transcriptional regulator GlxA family with amidase domain
LIIFISGKNDNYAIILAMKVYILVLEGVFDTGLSALLDSLTVANELAVSSGITGIPFNIKVVGVRQKITTHQGLSVPVVAAKQLSSPDVILLPALAAKMPDTLQSALKQKDIVDAVELLDKWANKNTLIAAACTGTFVLAKTGLLNGHSATTTWWLAPLFRELFPNVKLDESRMVTVSSPFITAGAALAHLDLALWLIRHQSPALAALAARYLVVDPRPSQAAFVIPDHLAHTDPLVEKFEQWARKQLKKGFSLSEAAKATHSSPRTLSRRLQTVLGKSPLAYFQDLRVERAVHLLQTSKANIEQVAAQVGYADGVTLRTLLRRKLGRGVRELRRKE